MKLKEHPILQGIYASEDGNIYTTRKHSGGSPTCPKLLTGTVDKGGYKILSFSEGKRKAHRLIADIWLPNPYNLRVVHHINHIKTDNRVCNLAWASARQNVIASHARYPKLIKNVLTGEVIEVECIRDFAEENGLIYGTLTATKSQAYTHKGEWKYLGLKNKINE